MHSKKEQNVNLSKTKKQSSVTKNEPKEKIKNENGEKKVKL